MTHTAKHAAPATTPALTPDQEVCQKIAEALWAAATSDTCEIAQSHLPVYSGLRTALLAAVKIAYGVDDETAGRVDDILADLGPLEGVSDAPGWGIQNFVAAAREEIREAEIAIIENLLH